MKLVKGLVVVVGGVFALGMVGQAFGGDDDESAAPTKPAATSSPASRAPVETGEPDTDDGDVGDDSDYDEEDADYADDSDDSDEDDADDDAEPTKASKDEWWYQYSSCTQLKKNRVGHPKGPFRESRRAEKPIYEWFAYGTGNRGDGDGDGLACE